MPVHHGVYCTALNWLRPDGSEITWLQWIGLMKCTLLCWTTQIKLDRTELQWNRLDHTQLDIMRLEWLNLYGIRWPWVALNGWVVYYSICSDWIYLSVSASACQLCSPSLHQPVIRNTEAPNIKCSFGNSEPRSPFCVCTATDKSFFGSYCYSILLKKGHLTFITIDWEWAVAFRTL